MEFLRIRKEMRWGRVTYKVKQRVKVKDRVIIRIRLTHGPSGSVRVNQCSFTLG